MFREWRQLMHFVMILGVAFAVGCGGSPPPPPAGSTTSSAPAAQAAATPAAPPTIPDLGAALAEGEVKPELKVTPPETEAPPTPAVEEDRQVAVAGVGRKGKDYGGGIISTPVSAYFGARERIAFIAVTDAMRKFNAEHDRDPESHEEFMEQIIKENGIQLPALFDYQRYEYDPTTGELMVVGPKR